MDGGARKSSRYSYYQLPEYRGHYAARPRSHQWGRPSMILFLTDLSVRWFLDGLFGTPQRPVRPIGIGDISFEDGSAPPTHDTHIFGSCVDIYILHKEGLLRSDQANRISISDTDAYDQDLTATLVRTIKALLNPHYTVIQFLFDDPEMQAIWPGTIRSKAGKPHRDHLHIQLGDENPYRGREAEILAQSMLQRRAGF